MGERALAVGSLGIFFDLRRLAISSTARSGGTELMTYVRESEEAIQTIIICSYGELLPTNREL